MKIKPWVPAVTHIPMKINLRGGKTVMVLPDGTRAIERAEVTLDSGMVKAISRAFRWQRFLQDGVFNTIEDLAAAEKINPSYVSRLLRLAFLSPRIIETILAGKHPAHLTLKDLLTPFPVDWKIQERMFLSGVPMTTRLE